MVFTGIIKAVGQGVFDVKSQILEVKAPAGFWQGLDAGDSVAIDGVCLTLLEAPSDSVPGRFFLQKETLQCTTFGDAEWNGAAGQRAVNVEAALQMHERLSGHLVLGHVHGVASVDSVQRNDDGSTEVWLRLPTALPAHLAQPVVVHKGSISLDGVSLTVAQVASDSDQLRVRVSLIPYTLGHTTLQFWQPGRRVNVEFAFNNNNAAAPSQLHHQDSKQELAPLPKWMGLDYVPPSPSLSPSSSSSSSSSLNNGNHHDDETFMNEAIELGEQGRETAPPNPWVGCVIVAGGGGRAVLGRGYHSAAGQAHAEVQALRNALQVQYPGMSAAEAQAVLSSVDGGQRQLNFLSGATLYVTLEPCVGFAGKRTPPCAGLLAALGLARVVVAIEDPDAAVRGRGVAALRAAGVRVDVGVAAERAARSLAAYIKQRSTGVPYVVCKAACSLDGAVAAQDGSSKWITDAACRQHAHRTLRARSGAIVVGSGTALADDPELTVRCAGDNRKQPLRVLLDSRGRVERGRLLCCDVAPTLVFTTPASRGSVARQRWTDAGVDVVELPGQRVDLHAVLRTLAGRGVLQVLLEGGAELHSAALAAGVVDRLVLYQGGVLLGSTAAHWLREPLTRSMLDVDGDERRWRVEHVQALGTSGMVSEWVSSSATVGGTPLQQARARVSRAVGQIRSGGMVLVSDDAARENEADLVVAAALVSEAQVATMIRHTTGILCAPMPAAHAERLQLPLMVANNEDAKKTAFTVSCDAVGVSTGVSALERRLTARVLASADSRPADLTRPGHVFPLIEHPGSVHARAGHTEASVALCRLAGIDPPVALIGELTNDDGTMSRLDDAEAFARRHGALPVLSVADLQLVLSSTDDADDEKKADVAEPLSRAAVIALARDGIDAGDWTVQMFGAQHPPSLRQAQRSSELIVLTKGDVAADAASPPLCRVHSACFTADCLGSVACDCGAQLSAAMRAIEREGRGVLLYMLQHEGRGIGLANKLNAYALMQAPDWNGHTYDANVALGFAPDERCYAAAAAALRALRLPAVRLLTNNPAKLAALQAAGVTATRTPLHAVAPSPRAAKYLSDKQRFGQHHATASDDVNPDQTAAVEHAATSQHKSLPALAPLLSRERAASLRVTVVRTAWNARLVDALVDGVVARLAQHGVTNVPTVQVGGAYELPLTAKRAAANSDAVIAIGILIKGETMHFEYISSAVSSGLMSVQLETDTPVIYGVLNVLDEQQAEARCRPDSGLASSWADTALSQIANDPRLQTN